MPSSSSRLWLRWTSGLAWSWPPLGFAMTAAKVYYLVCWYIELNKQCVRFWASSSAELPFRMLCFCSNFVFCARVSRRSTWREEELKKIGFELEVSKQKKHSVGLPTTLYCRRKLPMLSRRWDNKTYHERLVFFGVKLSTIYVNTIDRGVPLDGQRYQEWRSSCLSLLSTCRYHVSCFSFSF